MVGGRYDSTAALDGSDDTDWPPTVTVTARRAPAPGTDTHCSSVWGLELGTRQVAATKRDAFAEPGEGVYATDTSASAAVAGPKLEPLTLKACPPPESRSGAETPVTAGSAYCSSVALNAGDGVPPTTTEKTRPAPMPGTAGHATAVCGVVTVHADVT